jgi:hypothetical protein
MVPGPEPGSEACKEGVRKWKVDAGGGPVGKLMKIAGKKNITVLMAADAIKSAGAISSKVVSMPPKAALKAGAPPKATAQKAATAKSVPRVALGTVSGVVMVKAVSVGW